MITLTNSRVDTHGNTVINQETNQGSFVGQLWRNHIRPNIGNVVGGLVGGPVGGLVGGFVQRQINSCISDERIMAARGIKQEDIEDDYPLNHIEQELLISWVNSELIPSSQALINRIDSKTNIENSSINQEVIDECNTILEKVSTLKAYSSILSQFGERIPNSNGLFKSENYVFNKTNILNQFIDVVERSILQYLENANGYQVVLESFRASSKTQIENIVLDWQGKSANTNKKKYIKTTDEVNNNQTLVTIQNTNPEGNIEDIEVLNPNADEVVVTSNKKSLWKLGLFVAAAIVAYNSLPSDSLE